MTRHHSPGLIAQEMPCFHRKAKCYGLWVRRALVGSETWAGLEDREVWKLRGYFRPTQMKGTLEDKPDRNTDTEDLKEMWQERWQARGQWELGFTL